MSYAALMVYVDADGMPGDRVRFSASLADKFNAVLIGMSALAIRPPLVAEGDVIEDVVEADLKDMSVKLARKGSWFRGIVDSDHRKREWRPVFDFPNDALAREARAADLVVIGRTADPGDKYNSLDPGKAILRMGRPTLVVPEGVRSLRADHVVIGWKDTREARRAVQDSLPFLHKAGRVTIAEICGSGEEKAALEHMSDLGRYLEQHRVNVGSKIMQEQKGSSASQLIQLAQDEKADLLVTGAYGHSRLGEWVFGGMTRDLLTTSPMCCLMSH
jgi:nucleotide-binding universal stress UspA family protein